MHFCQGECQRSAVEDVKRLAARFQWYTDSQARLQSAMGRFQEGMRGGGDHLSGRGGGMEVEGAGKDLLGVCWRPAAAAADSQKC